MHICMSEQDGILNACFMSQATALQGIITSIVMESSFYRKRKDVKSGINSQRRIEVRMNKRKKWWKEF